MSNEVAVAIMGIFTIVVGTASAIISSRMRAPQTKENKQNGGKLSLVELLDRMDARTLDQQAKIAILETKVAECETERAEHQEALEKAERERDTAEKERLSLLRENKKLLTENLQLRKNGI